MFPDDRWSDPPQYSDIIDPRNATQKNPLIAYDNGPKNSTDESGGLTFAVWKAWADGDNVYISKSGGSAERFLFSDSAIEKVDLTFDQNGRAFIAYQIANAIKIWWFSPAAGSEISETIATGTQPFCHLDDRRPALSASSDIILIYERDKTVYWRKQRDRFLIEYETPLVNLRSCKIEAFGMGKNNRLTIRAIEPEL